MSKAGVGTFVTEDHELASSGLALFDLPIVDTSLVSGKFVTIYPRTVLSSEGVMGKTLLIYLTPDWRVALKF